MSKEKKLYEFRYIKNKTDSYDDRIPIGYGRYYVPKLSRIWKRLQREHAHNCFDLFGYTVKYI